MFRITRLRFVAGQRDRLLTAGDTAELLRVRRETSQRPYTADCADDATWHQAAAALFEQAGDVDQIQPAAAGCCWHTETKPSQSSNRQPRLLIDAALLTRPRVQTRHRDLLVAETAHGVFQLLLLGGEGEVHGSDQ